MFAIAIIVTAIFNKINKIIIIQSNKCNRKGGEMIIQKKYRYYVGIIYSYTFFYKQVSSDSNLFSIHDCIREHPLFRSPLRQQLTHCQRCRYNYCYNCYTLLLRCVLWHIAYVIGGDLVNAYFYYRIIFRIHQNFSLSCITLCQVSIESQSSSYLISKLF